MLFRSIFLPVSLAETRRLIHQGIDPSGQTAQVDGRMLGSSVETAMHTVLPYRVVIHVHSINAITWSVLESGEAGLGQRLSGVNWAWVPYVPSGLALAAAVTDAIQRSGGAKVLVLANHGLVVCGETVADAEALLEEVEKRINITPRATRQPRWDILNRLAESGNWWVPQCALSHAPALDETARRVVAGGVLYPCQAIFLTNQAALLPENVTAETLAASAREPFVLIENVGVLMGERSNPTEAATFSGLAEVLTRIPETSGIRYLTGDEVQDLLSADVYRYRDLVEGFGRVPFVREVESNPVGMMATKLA